MEMVFEILAQTEVVAEGVTGAGLDPKLAICSAIIAYLLQAMRRIKWVDNNAGAMPFVALGLGIAFAALKLHKVMPWEDIILSGCLLGLTASGFQAAATKLPMGMNAVKNVGNGAAVILLCLCLVGVAGCGGVMDEAPTGDQVLLGTVETYSAAMDTLTDFYEAGKIDDETVRKIDFHRKIAWAALEEWRACLRDGKPVSEAIRQFTTHFAALIEAGKTLNED